jgi:hypothetical protein
VQVALQPDIVVHRGNNDPLTTTQRIASRNKLPFR